MTQAPPQPAPTAPANAADAQQGAAPGPGPGLDLDLPQADDNQPGRTRLQEEAQEQAWITAAQAGDASAFGHLVRRHQASLRALLRRLCRGETARADELAQEAFLQAWQALPAFRQEARLRTWLYRLAYTAFLQDQRRPGQQVLAHSQPLPESGDVAGAFVGGFASAGAVFSERTGHRAPLNVSPTGHPSGAQSGMFSGAHNVTTGVTPGATHGVTHGVTHSASAAGISATSSDAWMWRLDLQRALDALPAGEREAVLHVEWAGLSHSEAAEVLGRPLGTVKTQVLRGRERLRLALAAWAPGGSSAAARAGTSAAQLAPGPAQSSAAHRTADADANAETANAAPRRAMPPPPRSPR